MYAKQKQTLDSFVRIRAFTEAHPATGLLTYGRALEMFDDAHEQCRRHAATQVSGRALSRGAQRQERELVARIMDRHMRPIVTIALAQVDPDSDVRLPAAFRMPKASLGATKMLARCDAMIEMAGEFEAVMIEEGLPADFVAQFAAARAELAASTERRATLRDAHVGARHGLPVALRRARLAVNRLDAVVRVAFSGDETVLAAWRTLKRVHRLAGRGERMVEVSGEAPVRPLLLAGEEVPELVELAAA